MEMGSRARELKIRCGSQRAVTLNIRPWAEGTEGRKDKLMGREVVEELRG